MNNTFEEIGEFNSSLSIRMKHEFSLFKAVDEQWAKMGGEKASYPKGYLKLKIKTIMRNVKKGIKIIERKNPLYIEMPKLEEVANGQVKKVYDEKLENKPDVEEILITQPDIPAIEDSK